MDFSVTGVTTFVYLSTQYVKHYCVSSLHNRACGVVVFKLVFDSSYTHFRSERKLKTAGSA